MTTGARGWDSWDALLATEDPARKAFDAKPANRQAGVSFATVQRCGAGGAVQLRWSVTAGRPYLKEVRVTGASNRIVGWWAFGAWGPARIAATFYIAFAAVASLFDPSFGAVSVFWALLISIAGLTVAASRYPSRRIPLDAHSVPVMQVLALQVRLSRLAGLPALADRAQAALSEVPAILVDVADGKPVASSIDHLASAAAAMELERPYPPRQSSREPSNAELARLDARRR